VTYAKAFFDLQLQFADKVAALSGLPPARVLLEYTNLYIRFGLGRDFDPAHPTWQEYLAGLESAPDIREWTYRFYLTRPLTRPGAMGAPPVVAASGCFSYARLSGDRIRLHFQNAEPDEHSPLALERGSQRLAELTALFGHVKRSLPQPTTPPTTPPRVVGASWLYNLAAYRRLFPPSYLVTAHAITPRFQHMPLWGQFLDRQGAIRENMTRRFLEHLEHQSSLHRLDQCFPFQVLAVGAPVQDFYDFYGI
jgi:hypothetical protein